MYWRPTINLNGWPRISMLAACLAVVGCASTDAQPEGEPSRSQERPAATEARTPDEKLPLYGTYFRPDPGLKPKKNDEWGIQFLGGEFATPAAWQGIVHVFYYDGRSEEGRAYEYSAELGTEMGTLILGSEARPRDKLSVGGFECQSAGAATYAWSRWANNYKLRLKAVEEPCSIRRDILEGEWQFFD